MLVRRVAWTGGLMLRHILTTVLEQLRARVPWAGPACTPQPRTCGLSEKACAEPDKLLDEVRFDANRAQFAQPFGPSELAPVREVVAWREACAAAAHCMAPLAAGGLGLKGWEDVGGLTRLEALGLLTLAIRRLSRTPEVGAGPLFQGF